MWERRFNQMMTSMQSFEHDNGKGSREELFEHFARELVEHMMYSLASKYLIKGRDEDDSINRDHMMTFFIRNCPENLDHFKWEILVDKYLQIFWAEGVIDGCEPSPENKMDASCQWQMGCSAKHWDVAIPSYSSSQQISEGLNIRSAHAEDIPRGLWEVLLLEKDHIIPKSKRSVRLVGEQMRANSQWLCSHHNRKWKGDKSTESIPNRFWE